VRAKALADVAEVALASRHDTSEARADGMLFAVYAAENTVTTALPAAIGATVAVAVAVAIASTRVGWAGVAVAGLGALVLGVARAGTMAARRGRVRAELAARSACAAWLTAAVRDSGEIATDAARARLAERLRGAAGDWSRAESRRERGSFVFRLAAAATLGVCAVAVGAKGLSGGILPLAVAIAPAVLALLRQVDALATALAHLRAWRGSVGGACARGGERLASGALVLDAHASVAYGGQEALRIDLENVPLAGMTAITGPNGAGKTTLARLVAGLGAPTSGAIRLGGADPRAVDRRDVAFVPQAPVLVESLTIADNVRLVATEASDPRIVEILTTPGLRQPLERQVGELSRGEAGRVGVARALLCGARVVVLDEPDAWLDRAGQEQLTVQLRREASERCVVVVTHADPLLDAADRRITVRTGKAVLGDERP